jgi:hypothetical protein
VRIIIDEYATSSAVAGIISHPVPVVTEILQKKA